MMLMFKIPLLGWGRPVQTNPLNYTRRFSRSTGHMLVAIAGPAMNMLMALLHLAARSWRGPRPGS